MPEKRRRTPISLERQLRVFTKDGWLCRWCHGPVVFGPALHLLAQFVKAEGQAGPVAYFHTHWSRRHAPLLDHLGAVVDHVEAFSKGGSSEDENLGTACNKCNARKNDGSPIPGRRVRGKYGEPTDWDGLTSVFLALSRRPGVVLTTTDQRWKKALERVRGEGWRLR